MDATEMAILDYTSPFCVIICVGEL